LQVEGGIKLTAYWLHIQQQTAVLWQL